MEQISLQCGGQSSVSDVELCNDNGRRSTVAQCAIITVRSLIAAMGRCKDISRGEYHSFLRASMSALLFAAKLPHYVQLPLSFNVALLTHPGMHAIIAWPRCDLL